MRIWYDLNRHALEKAISAAVISKHKQLSHCLTSADKSTYQPRPKNLSIDTLNIMKKSDLLGGWKEELLVYDISGKFLSVGTMKGEE